MMRMATTQPNRDTIVRRRTAEPSPGPGLYAPERFNAAISPPKRAVKREKPSSIYWAARGAPPSIPVSDQAWGYEEGDDGSLTLQQPAPMLFAPGPGSYEPLPEFVKRSPVSVNFGAGTGRIYRVPVDLGTHAQGPTSAVSEQLAPGDHEGQTSNPKPYQRLP
eukprot:3494375-Prymnesium_polylepis.1